MMVLYMHPLRLEKLYIGTATIEVAARAGNLLMAQVVYEHCSSHDKDLCKGTMPFFAAYNTND